jgi:hypothetical protein
MAALVPQHAFGCADERQRADVKSQGPDTPTLVSSAMRVSALSLTRRSFASRGYGGQKARRTRETAYKRENRRAGNAG